MDSQRVIEVLREMLNLAKENRCVYCGWRLDGQSSCTRERCSFVPMSGTYDDLKMKERYRAMGLLDAQATAQI